MSGNYKNTSGYSASDIQKYWRGELSAREMQELEKAALEDPFLADALEGMELHQALPEPAAFDRDLEELQARLQARVAQKADKKAIPFRRLLYTFEGTRSKRTGRQHHSCGKGLSPAAGPGYSG